MAPETNPRGREPVLGLALSFIMVGVLLFFGWRVVAVFAGRSLRSEMARFKDAETDLRRGNIGKARGMYDGEIAKQPTSPEIYAQVSESCLESGQWNLAIEYAKRGVSACKSATPKEQAMLYRVLAEASSEAEPAHPQTAALQYAEMAFKLTPKDPETLNMLGYILADNDLQLERARGLVHDALVSIKDETGTPEGRFAVAEFEDSYGWILYKLHQYPQAVEALVQATGDIATAPNTDEENAQSTEVSGDVLKTLYYHLGAAQRMAGSKDAAATSLNTALRYDPGYAPAKREMAELEKSGPPNPQPEPTAPSHSPITTETPSVTLRSNPPFTPLSSGETPKHP